MKIHFLSMNKQLTQHHLMGKDLYYPLHSRASFAINQAHVYKHLFLGSIFLCWSMCLSLKQKCVELIVVAVESVLIAGKISPPTSSRLSWLFLTPSFQHTFWNSLDFHTHTKSIFKIFLELHLVCRSI